MPASSPLREQSTMSSSLIDYETLHRHAKLAELDDGCAARNAASDRLVLEHGGSPPASCKQWRSIGGRHPQADRLSSRAAAMYGQFFASFW